MQTQRQTQPAKKPFMSPEAREHAKQARRDIPRLPVLSIDGKSLDPMDHREVRIVCKRGSGQIVHVNGVPHLQMLRVVGDKTAVS